MSKVAFALASWLIEPLTPPSARLAGPMLSLGPGALAHSGEFGQPQSAGTSPQVDGVVISGNQSDRLRQFLTKLSPPASSQKWISNHASPSGTDDQRDGGGVALQVGGIFLGLRQADPEVVQRLQLDVRKDVENPSARLPPAVRSRGRRRPSIRSPSRWSARRSVGAFMVQASPAQIA